jgi:predicted ATPase
MRKVGLLRSKTSILRPHFLALLAEALEKAGETRAGLNVLEEALAVAQHTGERYYEAELYRLKGELLRKVPKGRAVSRAATAGRSAVTVESSAVMNAEICFKQSIAIAQRQKANALGLRAAMSLARLYQTHGRNKEARDLVTETYDRFTEGFDTAARALLDELS